MFQKIVEFAKRAWGWVKDKAKYLKGGKLVSETTLKKLITGWVENEITPAIQSVTERFLAGYIDLPGWQQAMAKEIKDAHLAAAMTGRGGQAVMTPVEWGKVGSRIKLQYQHLNGFAAEVEAGNLTEAQILYRAKSYARSAQQSYYDGLTRANLMGEPTEERRRIMPGENCPDCIAYEAMGWVPIGTLPEPGEGSVCLNNCNCIKEYR